MTDCWPVKRLQAWERSFTHTPECGPSFEKLAFGGLVSHLPNTYWAHSTGFSCLLSHISSTVNTISRWRRFFKTRKSRLWYCESNEVPSECQATSCVWTCFLQAPRRDLVFQSWKAAGFDVAALCRWASKGFMCWTPGLQLLHFSYGSDSLLNREL